MAHNLTSHADQVMTPFIPPPTFTPRLPPGTGSGGGSSGGGSSGRARRQREARERARRKAAEEARRKAAEEARRKAAEEARRQRQVSSATSFFRRRETINIRKLPPRTQEPVRSIDVGTRDRGRVGGVTIRGGRVGGGSSGGGSSRRGRITQTDIPISEAQRLSGVQDVAQGVQSPQVARDIEILQRREALKRQAEERGRSFTRLEAERFLGGAKGVRRLREATERDRQRSKQGKPTIKETLRQRSATNLLLGGGAEAVEPVVETRVVDSFRPEGSLREVPITKTFLVNPVTGETIRELQRGETQNVLQAGEGQPSGLTRIPFLSDIVSESKKRTEIAKSNLAEFGLEGLTFGDYKVLQKGVSEELAPGMGGKGLSPTDILLFSTPAQRVPKKIETPLRARQETPQFQEVSRDVINQGKKIRESSFRITTEIKPPVEVLKQTRKGGFLDSSLRTRPAKTTVTKTPFKAINQEEFITLSTKGSKTGKLEKVVPVDSRFISPQMKKEFAGMSNIERFILKNIAERRAGRPVSISRVPPTLPKDVQFVKGSLEVRDIGRVKLFSKGKTGLAPPRAMQGRRTRRFETISELKKIPEESLSKQISDRFNLFKVRTSFKDVTKPLSRASGEIPTMEGLVAEFKKPLVTGGTGVKSIAPADIKKTPLSKTFGEQLTKQIYQIPPPPKPSRSRARATTRRTSSVISRVAPVSASQFTGTGLYERSEGGQTPGVVLKDFTPQRDFQRDVIKVSNFQAQPPRIEEITRTGSGQREIQKQVNVQKDIAKEIQKTIPQQRQFPSQREALKQRELLKQREIQKLFSPKTPPAQRVPRVPKRPKSPPTTFEFPKPTRQLQQVTPNFKVLGRRFGRWKIVGIGRSPLEAVGIGKNWAKTTLGRSFAVPSFKGNRVLPEFRTKKEKDIGTIFIEKAKYPGGSTLGTAGEISEIQAFLRKSGKVGGKKKSSPVSSVQKEIKKQMMFFRKKDDDSIGILAV